MRPSSLATRSKDASRRPRFIIIVCVVIAVTIIYLSMPRISYEESFGIEEKSDYAKTKNAMTRTYQCPADQPSRSKNDKGDNFHWYLEDDEAKNDITEVHNMTFDGWGTSVEELKDILRPWIEESFVPYLKSGDHIYESACGSGINLLLTAEILLENNISSIVVNGNDYLEQSIRLANQIWNLKAVTEVAKKGVLCRGDSTNLSFVPSAMFDLVYTGYIDPILDPLNILPENTTQEEKSSFSARLCTSENPKDQETSRKEQTLQEEWFAAWALEMIRIAKPGVPIIAESLDESICTNLEGWGGVDKDWWKSAISVYGFDIDPESIVTKPAGFPGIMEKRYHVMMRKNP